jgi:hypothetical protein
MSGFILKALLVFAVVAAGTAFAGGNSGDPTLKSLDSVLVGVYGPGDPGDVAKLEGDIVARLNKVGLQARTIRGVPQGERETQPCLETVVAPEPSCLATTNYRISMTLRQVMVLKRDPKVEISLTTWQADFGDVSGDQRKNIVETLREAFVDSWREQNPDKIR